MFGGFKKKSDNLTITEWDILQLKNQLVSGLWWTKLCNGTRF